MTGKQVRDVLMDYIVESYEYLDGVWTCIECRVKFPRVPCTILGEKRNIMPALDMIEHFRKHEDLKPR